jgi:hypothetical protein
VNWRAIVAWLRKNASNPFVVTAWTLFAGAFGKELLTTLQTGHVDLSLKSIESMVAAAVSTAAIALLHLYLPQPNPTVAATIPPSKTVVDVPAQLEPVDPKAIAIPEDKPK